MAWTLVWAPPASRCARCRLPPDAERGHCHVPGGQARNLMQLSPSSAGAATVMSLLYPSSSSWPAKQPAKALGRPPAQTSRCRQWPQHHWKDRTYTQESFWFSPPSLAAMPQAGFVLCFLMVPEGEDDQSAGLSPRCRSQWPQLPCTPVPAAWWPLSWRCGSMDSECVVSVADCF